MEGGHGSLRWRHSVVLAALDGFMWWPYWALVLQAPAVAELTGVPAGLIGALLEVGVLLGALALGFTPLGRRRRRLAIASALLIAASIWTLGQPVASQPGVAWTLIALVGAACSTANGAILSIVLRRAGDETARRRALFPYGAARAVMFASSGPACDWIAARHGLAALLVFLTASVLVAGGLLAGVCPDADREPLSVEQAAAEHGSLRWLAVARLCASAQVTTLTVFVPLALATREQSSAGWTQFAFMLGFFVFWWSSRVSAAGTPIVSSRAIVTAGPLVMSVAAVIALALPLVAGAAAVAVAGTARSFAVVGSMLYACVITAAVGATSRGLGTSLANQAAGSALPAIVGGLVWTWVDPSVRYEAIMLGALALGVTTLVATQRWLNSRSSQR